MKFRKPSKGFSGNLLVNYVRMIIRHSVSRLKENKTVIPDQIYFTCIFDYPNIAFIIVRVMKRNNIGLKIGLAI